MTDKQLKRLKKLELLEIMIAQDKELEMLRKRNKEIEEEMKLLQELLEKILKKDRDSEPGVGLTEGKSFLGKERSSDAVETGHEGLPFRETTL